jgi:tetratricopeptide (TPR) repeat protein
MRRDVDARRWERESMPANLICLRVFIASPGGLAEERKVFRNEVADFNDADAIPRGIFFQALGWEDTLGGIGRPQGIINEDLQKSDYCVVMLWDRWGSRPDTVASKYTSGTEEEYHVALDCCKKGAMRQMVLMFKAVDPRRLSDAGPELEKVLQFKKSVEEAKRHLFHTFDTTDAFRKLCRRYLAAWLRDHENGGSTGTAVPAPPNVPADELRTKTDSVNLAQEEPTPRTEDTVTAKAWELASKGRITDAEVEFARNIVGQQNSSAFIEYGRFLRRVGRLDQAATMFNSALDVAQNQGELAVKASAYTNLGIVLETQGNLDGAEQMYRKSLEINERLGSLKGLACNYGNLGILLQVRGDLSGAEQMHRKSLEIEERLGHLKGVAKDSGNLGNVLLVKGDLEGAEQMHRKSLEINERLRSLEGIANNYGNLGTILQIKGDLEGAEQMYRKSLEINGQLGVLEGMASTYGNLGIVLKTRGDLSGAEQMHRKSLEIEERLGHLEGVAKDYGNLGNVLQIKGDLEGAEQMHRKSLEINERLRSLEGLANNYGNLGNVLKARGDRNGAEQMYRKSLEFAKRLGSSTLAEHTERLLGSLTNKVSNS